MAKFLSKDGKFYMRDGKLLQYTIPVSRTWVINESPDADSSYDFDANFTLKNSAGIGESNFIGFRSIGVGELEYKTGLSTSIVPYTGTWDDQAYRTIVFETTPTGELLTWLQSNATQV